MNPYSQFQNYSTAQKKIKRSSTIESSEDNTQYDGSGFSLIQNIKSDTPMKQCRNLFDLLKQKPSSQEMSVLNYLSDQKKIKYENKPDRTFTQYSAILNYADQKNKTQQFRQKQMKSHMRMASNQSHQNSNHKINSKIRKHHQRNLTQIMQTKKNQFLEKDNILYNQKLKIQNMLSNPNVRKNVLQKAILFQRLYHLQQLQKPEKKNSQLPQRFTGVNPKHLRVPQKIKDEQTHYRRKFVYGLRKFQFYHHANKLQRSFINKKRDANATVINIILDTAKQQAHQKSKNIDKSMPSAQKLFLNYSSSQVQNPQQMFKFIFINDLYRFFKDFQFKYEDNEGIKKLISKKQVITYFQFYQMLYEFALAKKSNQKLKQSQSSVKNVQQQQQQEAAVFLITNLLIYLSIKYPKKYYPHLWIKMKKFSNEIKKATKFLKFTQQVQKVYQKCLFKIGKADQGYLLSLTDILEMFWDMGLYPKKIVKRLLRFYYLYAKSQELGLTIDDFKDLLIAISIQKCQNGSQVMSQIKQVIKLMNLYCKENINTNTK